MHDRQDILTGMNALVVDDVAFSVTLVSGMLRELGCNEVHGANGGVDALKLMQSDQGRDIDLVVLDMNMPGIDGLTILRMIREELTEVKPTATVALLTGVSEERVVRAAFALNVDAYVMKPVSKAALGARLARAVAQRRSAGSDQLKRSA